MQRTGPKDLGLRALKNYTYQRHYLVTAYVCVVKTTPPAFP